MSVSVMSSSNELEMLPEGVFDVSLVNCFMGRKLFSTKHLNMFLVFCCPLILLTRRIGSVAE